MTSDDVAKGAKRNTIVAAECCYGAQLFKPSAAGQMPIATAYLNTGAIAFLGSTNIAYGSLDGNAGADLIAQYFLVNVLDRKSVGRAFLQARQKFVHCEKMENPVNLKTLAQFVLLGDPSLQPVRSEPRPNGFSKYVDLRETRKTRRIALAAAGEAAASCSGFPEKKLAFGKIKLHRLVRKIALQRGFKVGADAVEAYQIIGRYSYANQMKARNVKQNVFVVMQQRERPQKTASGVPRTRILVAHTENDNLTDIFEYVSR